jgi:hypothetical protein
MDSIHTGRSVLAWHFASPAFVLTLTTFSFTAHAPRRLVPRDAVVFSHPTRGSFAVRNAVFHLQHTRFQSFKPNWNKVAANPGKKLGDFMF